MPQDTTGHRSIYKPAYFRRGAFAAAAAVACLVSACGSSGSQSSAGTSTGSGGTPVTSIKVQGTSNDSSWPAFVAQAEGFFTKNNLKVSLITVVNEPTATAALEGGAYDIANFDLFNAAPLLVNGQSLKLLSGDWHTSLVLMGKPHTKATTLGQLMPLANGTSFGAPSVGGDIAGIAKYIEQAYGSKASNLNIVVDPKGAALLSGQADYGFYDPLSACVIATQGATQVFSFGHRSQPTSSYPAVLQNLIGLPDNGYWTTGSWAQAHPAAITEFQKSIAEAIQFMEANPSKVASLLRASSIYNPSSLSNSQLQSCVNNIIPDYNVAFPTTAAAKWNTFLRAEDVIKTNLPAYNTWQVPGIPR
jgi:ABC-type nitrate/sulfonate/bicarbonate transport system substrate-binding protein